MLDELEEVDEMDVAIQDAMHIKTCFGCGAENAKGLRIKTHWDGEAGRCTYHPEPHMMAGPPQFLNGGIVATLIDCHCISTAIAYLYAKEGRAAGSDPGIWCVTGSLQVDYKRPTPIDRPCTLTARVASIEGRRLTVDCTLESDDKVRAEGRVVAVRVEAEWTGVGR
jgi:acyl-coenzyme A thioesterase PaaI-like protein